MLDGVSVAVIIPVIDEEGALPHVLTDLALVHHGPVFVVDGGSRDRTVAFAEEHGAVVIVERRRGYGRACITGAERAIAGGADIVVFLDGDYSDDPTDLPRLLAPILEDKADLVIGERIPRLRKQGAMVKRQAAGNVLVALLLRLFYGVALVDPGPFRAMSSQVYTLLDLRETTYGWPVEAIARASRLGCRVHGVPVSYRPRIGTSKISGTLRGSFMAGYHMLRAVFRYR